MQDYVDDPPYPRGGYGKDPDKFGLNPAAVNERFATYRETYAEQLSPAP